MEKTKTSDLDPNVAQTLLKYLRQNEYIAIVGKKDNTDPAATDTNNPYGTPEKPRLTWPYPLGAGAAVQVHGGPYVFSNSSGKMIAGGPGTLEKPIFIYGTTNDPEAMPKVTRPDVITYGNNLIVERLRFDSGCRVDTRSDLKQAQVINVCVRDCYFFGTGVPTTGSAMGLGKSSNTAATAVRNFLFLRNTVQNYGDWQGDTESDVHGFTAGAHCYNIWVLDCHIFHMGGDSVQLGTSQAAQAPPCGPFYIGRNRFHHNRENAIDIKQVVDVVMSENVMEDFAETDSSAGEALVVHYAAENIWIINNLISRSERGITSTGINGVCYVIGNIVHNCSEYGMYLTRGGGTFYVYNNTVDSCANGMITSGAVDALHYKNNIVSNVSSSSGYHLQISDPVIAGRSTASTFLFFQPSGSIRLRWGDGSFSSASSWISTTGQGTGSTLQDPKYAMVAEGNYHLLSGSPAIDAGVDASSYNTVFQNRFGIAFTADMDGHPRPIGPKWEIGADEYAPAGTVPPKAPANLRVVEP